MKIKRYNTKFMFYITKNTKKEIRKRSKELDISMSDYIRTLIKKDLKECAISNNILEQDKNMYDVDNFNKKLSGYYRGL